jgi:hypothetical protein
MESWSATKLETINKEATCEASILETLNVCLSADSRRHALTGLIHI